MKSETNKKKQKANNEVKDELLRSFVEGKDYESKELSDRADNVKRYREAIPLIKGYLR